MIDIYHSRRTKYKKCEYWLRDKDSNVYDLEKWVYENKPKGEFYVQEASSKTLREAQINNAMLFNSNEVVLETNDDIADVENGTIIRYLNKVWVVSNIQASMHNKESEFGGEHRSYFLSIRR